MHRRGAEEKAIALEGFNASLDQHRAGVLLATQAARGTWHWTYIY